MKKTIKPPITPQAIQTFERFSLKNLYRVEDWCVMIRVIPHMSKKQRVKMLIRIAGCMAIAFVLRIFRETDHAFARSMDNIKEWPVGGGHSTFEDLF